MDPMQTLQGIKNYNGVSTLAHTQTTHYSVSAAIIYLFYEALHCTAIYFFNKLYTVTIFQLISIFKSLFRH